MSRNDVIVVIRFDGRWHVCFPMNADTQWNVRACIDHIRQQRSLAHNSRAHALVSAHNVQRKLGTEYGVRELFPRRRPT